MRMKDDERQLLAALVNDKPAPRWLTADRLDYLSRKWRRMRWVDAGGRLTEKARSTARRAGLIAEVADCEDHPPEPITEATNGDIRDAWEDLGNQDHGPADGQAEEGFDDTDKGWETGRPE